MLKGCSFGKICTSYMRVMRIIAFNVISEKLRKVNLGREKVLSFSVIKQERCFTCSRELALTFQGLNCSSVKILSSFTDPSTTVWWFLSLALGACHGLSVCLPPINIQSFII